MWGQVLCRELDPLGCCRKRHFLGGASAHCLVSPASCYSSQADPCQGWGGQCQPRAVTPDPGGTQVWAAVEVFELKQLWTRLGARYQPPTKAERWTRKRQTSSGTSRAKQQLNGTIELPDCSFQPRCPNSVKIFLKVLLVFASFLFILMVAAFNFHGLCSPCVRWGY